MSNSKDLTLEDRELGTKPISSLFLKYSLIALIGLAAQGVMVILEGFIVGYGMGERGFAIVSLIMPLETFNVSLNSLFGFGVSTIAGVKMGNGDFEGARKSVGQTTWFTFLFSVTISFIAIVAAPTVASFLGAPAELQDEVVLFIRIYFCIFPFSITGQTLSFVGRVDEKPGLVSAVMTLGSIVGTCVLYFGLIQLKAGVPAIAFYYSLSTGVYFALIFYFFFNKKTKLKIRFSDIKINFKEIYEVVKIGLPTFLVSASLAVYAIVINNKLSVGGELELAAYGLVNGYVLFFIALVTQAFQGGMAPIVSYNYGAKNYGRLKQVLISGNIISIVIVQVFCIIFYFLATPLNALFASGETELIEMASRATKIVIFLYSIGSISGMMSVYYQSMEKLVKATFFGACRYIVFALPLLFILPNIMDPVDGVWFAHPYSDILTGLFCVVFIVLEVKLLKKDQAALESKKA